MKDMKGAFFTLAPILMMVLFFSNWVDLNNNSQKSNEEVMSNFSESEWIELFDGKTTDGWRGFNMESIPPNWIVEDGTLKSLGTGGDVGGDIIYGDQQFANFELQLEWKISEGGNSGIFYHVVEDKKYKAPYETGPEYQLIDDLGYPGKLEEWRQKLARYPEEEV